MTKFDCRAATSPIALMAASFSRCAFRNAMGSSGSMFRQGQVSAGSYASKSNLKGLGGGEGEEGNGFGRIQL